MYSLENGGEDGKWFQEREDKASKEKKMVLMRMQFDEEALEGLCRTGSFFL